jgi:hypothetical protein
MKEISRKPHGSSKDEAKNLEHQSYRYIEYYIWRSLKVDYIYIGDGSENPPQKLCAKSICNISEKCEGSKKTNNLWLNPE